MRCLSTGLGVAFGWLWVALCSPLSDFSFQLSAFQLLPNCGFGVACPPSHESRITNHLRLWVAVPGLSMLEVGCWMLGSRPEIDWYFGMRNSKYHESNSI